jgi:hypothetical protein
MNLKLARDAAIEIRKIFDDINSKISNDTEAFMILGRACSIFEDDLIDEWRKREQGIFRKGHSEAHQQRSAQKRR